jgi:predicted small metal-binding protein
MKVLKCNADELKKCEFVAVGETEEELEKALVDHLEEHHPEDKEKKK